MHRLVLASLIPLLMPVANAFAESPASAGAVAAAPSYAIMTSPSALDHGTNSNYPLDPVHTQRLMSSPSASDRGTNSNYPLDPQTQVAVDNGTAVVPNNDGPVQSPNSMPSGY